MNSSLVGIPFHLDTLSWFRVMQPVFVLTP